MNAEVFSVVSFNTDDRSRSEIAFSIRNQVFVEEQKVSREEEYDSHESESVHYLLFAGDEAIGTARMRETKDGVKLERFAVLPAYRNRGAGSVLVHHVLQDAQKFNLPVYLNAQVPAMNVYSRAGFKAVGPLFYEAGLPHYRMELHK